MPWDTASNNDGLVERDEAKTKILEMARNQGIEGAFKVFYQGNLVSTPDALPDMVDVTQIRVSAVLDQAHNHWFVDGFGTLTALSLCR